MRLQIAAILLLLAGPLAAQTVSQNLKAYDGRYYQIHTDLAGDDLREAELRMTKMAEEYRTRTKDFAGSVGHKFPFFLFRNPIDYYAAGGKEGSAGFFDPNNDTLMAVAGKQADAYTWRTIQHEGFHQFAHSVIGGELPVWVNEGLAEYFAEGVFTGDGFVTGVIPQERLDHIRQELRGKEFKPVKEMMLLRHEDWNEKLTISNYDQAWSMVQFLAHAENGKYQAAFATFVRGISKGLQWDQAWLRSFGSAEGFEQKWKAWWLKLPDDPTADLYAKAMVQTITGVLARATAQRQKFASLDELSAAVAANELKIDNRDWLPPGLITDAFARAKKMQAAGATLELRSAGVGCTLKNGTRLLGRFTIVNGHVNEVTVDMPKH